MESHKKGGSFLLQTASPKRKINVTNNKIERRIPFDQAIKILLLALHAIGFSGWFGGVLIGPNSPPFSPVLTNISGILLVLRELYKEGWEWLIFLEGGLTILKVILLILAVSWQGGCPMLLGAVLVCGLLTSHLPKEIKERRLYAAKI